MDPSWVYGKVLQKPLHRVLNESDREPASYKNLEVRSANGWQLVENLPEVTKKKILLLPGFLGSDDVFHEMLHDPALLSQGVKLVAGNAPGFAGLKVPPHFQFTIEEYAALVEDLAKDEKFDVLVGHSYMATVLTEVARRGKYQGKLVLISPALESDDEPLSTRALDLITRDPLMKDVAWSGMYTFMEHAFSGFFKSGDWKHIKRAAAEARKTPIPYAQRMLVQYFNYLRDDTKSLMKSASFTSLEIHYVHGGKDVVQLKQANVKSLQVSGKVTFHHYPNASHMVMIDEAKNLNKLLFSL